MIELKAPQVLPRLPKTSFVGGFSEMLCTVKPKSVPEAMPGLQPGDYLVQVLPRGFGGPLLIQRRSEVGPRFV